MGHPPQQPQTPPYDGPYKVCIQMEGKWDSLHSPLLLLCVWIQGVKEAFSRQLHRQSGEFPNSTVLLWYVLLKSLCELCKLHAFFKKQKTSSCFLVFDVF